MALQQLKDRYSYAGNLWFKDNPDAYIVPYPYSRDLETEAVSIRAALNGSWDDIRQVVSQQRGAVMLIDQDTAIKNRDLKLDYQGKEILVGGSTATLIPPDLLYAYAMSRDDMHRVSIKHIDVDEFRNNPMLWYQLCHPRDYEAPHCHFMLVEDKKPVAACVGNYFWFEPGIRVSQDRSVVFQEPLDFEAARQRKKSLLHYFPVLEDYMDKKKYSGRSMSERDHALLDYALGMLRASTKKDGLEKAVSSLEIDLNMHVPERVNVASKVPLLLTDQSEPAPLRLPAPMSEAQFAILDSENVVPEQVQEKPGLPALKNFHGQFDAAINAKGYLTIPKAWRDDIEEDFLVFYDRVRQRLVCFNEDVAERIETQKVGQHWYYNLHSAHKRVNGQFHISDTLLKIFVRLRKEKPAKFQLRLKGTVGASR